MIEDNVYTITQILTNGTTATYDHLLTSNAELSHQLSGTYGCIVRDSLGHNSAHEVMDIQGEFL